MTSTTHTSKAIIQDGLLESSSLLSTRDVAQLLQRSVRQVYRLIDSGRMPQPVRIGSLVRWHPSTIEAWIKQGCPIVRQKGGRR